MTVRTILTMSALALCAIGLTACVEATQGQSGYYDPYGYNQPPPPPPPQRGYYYYPPASPYQSGYHSQAYEREQREHQQRQQTNCNVAWTNCANGCNTMANQHQRATCIANCNNYLNQCNSNIR